MPLINGMCIPPVCWKLTYNVAAAYYEVYDKRRKRVDQPRTNLAQAANAFAQELAAYKAKYAMPVVFDCDGCRCMKPRNPPPAVPMQTEDIPPVQPRYQPRLNGGMVVVETGICVKPGTRIRFEGEDWQTAQAPSRPPEQYVMGKRKRPRKKAPARRKR